MLAVTDHQPALAVLVMAAALWLAFEHLGLAHWYVKLHPESVRRHYTTMWAVS